VSQEENCSFSAM